MGRNLTLALIHPMSTSTFHRRDSRELTKTILSRGLKYYFENATLSKNIICIYLPDVTFIGILRINFMYYLYFGILFVEFMYLLAKFYSTKQEIVLLLFELY